MLRPLSDESPMIAEAVAKLPPGKYDTGATAKDWFARRIKNQRIKNRTVCRSFIGSSIRLKFHLLRRVQRRGGAAGVLSTNRQRTSRSHLIIAVSIALMQRPDIEIIRMMLQYGT